LDDHPQAPKGAEIMKRNQSKSQRRRLCLTVIALLAFALASASGCAAGIENDVNAVCGNGVLETDAGETCDDGNTIDGDGCDARCNLEGAAPCGNGIIELGEDCDDGAANSDTASGACRTDCTLPFCGDGVLDPLEQCDDGAANSDTVADACRTDCREPHCGDKVVDADEQCDPPSDSESASIEEPMCCGDCTEGPCPNLTD
jgi:cysteine-rich repeat protein